MNDCAAPNFFIVGAPKCGTTALAAYLSEHPNVFMCMPKEPHYFATDFPNHRDVKDWESYLRLFAGVKEKHLAVGEASVWYFFSQQACTNIKQYKSDAKIIVMLRNPVDLVYSMHSENVHSADEDQTEFEAAWRLQADRKNGKQLPPRCRTPAMLQYGEIGMLGEQLQRLLQVFPSEQVLEVVFDDFARDPMGQYQKVLSFLGVPDDGRSEFPVVNENKQHKYLRLGHFLRRSSSLQTAWLGAKRLLHLPFAPGDWLRSMNTVVVKRPPLDHQLRMELLTHFDRDIRLVESLLGRKLSWR